MPSGILQDHGCAWELHELLHTGLRVGVSVLAPGWMQGYGTGRGGSVSALPEAPRTRTRTCIRSLQKQGFGVHPGKERVGEPEVGRPSRQSERTLCVCVCFPPGVRILGSPWEHLPQGTHGQEAGMCPPSKGCTQAPWATVFHGREASGPGRALASGFSSPQQEQVPGVSKIGGHPRALSSQADHRLSLPDALHPQPAYHTVP